MRKKVFFLSLMALVMVAGAIFGVVSCSKDGDGGSNAGVVGTWFGQRGNSHTLQVTFNANQSGYWVENIYDSYSGNSTDQGSFTYSMSDAQNGYVYVQGESSYGDWETERIRFSISGSTMYIYNDYGSYGNQVVWTLTKR